MFGLELVATITGIIVGALGAYIASSKWIREIKETERKKIAEEAIAEVHRARDIGHLQRDLEQLKIGINQQFKELEMHQVNYAGSMEKRIHRLELLMEKMSAKLDSLHGNK